MSAQISNVLPLSFEREARAEKTDYDHKAKVCTCGAKPLITSTGGSFYMSCPPCWVRTHAVANAEMARKQWNAMLNSLARLG